MIETKGKISQIHEKCRHQFGIDSELTDTVTVLTIDGSHQLIQNHLSITKISNQLYKYLM